MAQQFRAAAGDIIETALRRGEDLIPYGINMMLESKDDFDELVDLNPATGTYQLLSRKEHSELTTTPPFGCYSIVSHTILSLYRKEGVLYFRVGELEFKLTDNITSTLSQEGNMRVFQLRQDGDQLFILRYPTPVQDVALLMDPTPFVEEEDFDFLLFVHKVLTETGRRHRVYTQ